MIATAILLFLFLFLFTRECKLDRKRYREEFRRNEEKNLQRMEKYLREKRIK